MAFEITANAIQTVEPNRNVLFTETPIPCTRGYVYHRDGSGIVTLRGITNQCRARYRVAFGGNISLNTATVALTPISVAITIDGEPITSTIMTINTLGADSFFNVYASTIIDVPRGCCVTVSVENITDDTEIDVSNANLTIDRIA